MNSRQRKKFMKKIFVENKLIFGYTEIVLDGWLKHSKSIGGLDFTKRDEAWRVMDLQDVSSERMLMASESLEKMAKDRRDAKLKRDGHAPALLDGWL